MDSLSTGYPPSVRRNAGLARARKRAAFAALLLKRPTNAPEGNTLRMLGGRLAAERADGRLRVGDARDLVAGLPLFGFPLTASRAPSGVDVPEDDALLHAAVVAFGLAAAVGAGYGCSFLAYHVRSLLDHLEGQDVEFRPKDCAGHDLLAVPGGLRDVVVGLALHGTPVESDLRSDPAAPERPSGHKGQWRNDLVGRFAPPHSLDDVGLAVQGSRIERFAVDPLEFLVANGVEGVALAFTPVDARRIKGFPSGIADVERSGWFSSGQSEAEDFAVGRAPYELVGSVAAWDEVKHHPKTAFAFGGTGEVPVGREVEVLRRLELVAGRDQEILRHLRSPAMGRLSRFGSESSLDHSSVLLGSPFTHLSLLPRPSAAAFPAYPAGRPARHASPPEAGVAGRHILSETLWTRYYILPN